MFRDSEEIEKRVEYLLEPLLEIRGMVLVDIEIKGIGNRGLLRIFVDKEGGVTIKDCADLSKELSVLLDAEDFIPGPYILEVSSPGIGRVLKKDRELKWAIGKDVIVYTREKAFSGKLLEFDEKIIKIALEDKEYSISRAEITKIKLEDRE